MYLKRVSLKSYRGIDSLALDFDPGINVLCGPNESGKSTLREALRHAFQSPSSMRGKSAIRAIRPWGSKQCPRVEVEFHHEGELWLLKRVFFGTGSELIRSDRVVAQEDNVLAYLEDSLARLTVLWSAQGEDKLAQIPTGLQPQLAAAEAVTPGISQLETSLDERYAEYWTPKLESPRKPLLDARATFQEAQQRVDGLRRDLEALNQTSYEVELLDRQLHEEQGREARLAAELEGARAQQAAWERFRASSAEIARREEEHKGVERWLQEWSQCAAELGRLERLATEYREKAALGEEPSPARLVELRARLAFVQQLIQQRLRAELDELNPPGAARLSRLETLHRRIALAADVAARLADAARLQTSLRQQEPALAELEAEEAEQQKEQRRRDALEQKVAELQKGLKQWRRQRGQLLSTWQEVLAHRERLAGLPAAHPPAPSGLQHLKAREQSLEAR
ncbi:MAG: AAA family ATPase, partial [Candidatus Eremiobacterota bacterium]